MKLTNYKETLTAITENPTKQLFKLNCLLANLNTSQQYKDTLHLFHQIHSSHHLKPDHYTLSTALTAAANLHGGDTPTGSQLHAYAIRAGLKPFPHVSNTLLSLYAKLQNLVSVKRVFDEIKDPDVYSWTTLLSACTKLGDIDYAYHVFDQMPYRDVAIWNAMITGCVNNGYDDMALSLFQKMHLMGVMHDNYSLASVLSVCSLELLAFGRQMHSLVMKTGYMARASVVNALLTMYFSCESSIDGFRVFEEVEANVCDEITYNAMINGLVSMDRDEEALLVFKDMLNVGLRPTGLTFVSVMSSSSSARVVMQLHTQMIKVGFEDCTSVCNAAMAMYSTCGELNAVRKIFERLTEKDIVSWNTMINCYSQENIGRDSILTYLHMQREGFERDEFTMGSLLSSSESITIVEMIQAIVVKTALILKIEVSNALLSSLFKHGEINQAYQIFNAMHPKNLISWNTLISGCQLNGFPVRGLETFSELQASKLHPNVYTLSIVLNICSTISALQQGKLIHGYIIKFGFLSDISLGNALITLYAKCGALDSSVRVFEEMVVKDIVSWNSMISAYAQHGQGNDAIDCFEVMRDSAEVTPDKATFTAVLSACSHSGLVHDGIRIFNSMAKTFGIEPGVDQFSCIVDLLGRAGYLDETERLVYGKHIEIDPSVWWTLFSSCVAHGNLRLGSIVAGFLLETEENNSAVYVLLSNIYANAGEWEESANVRELMKKYKVSKQPASSWIGS